MSRFLFATMPATGHVTPKLPIAGALVARGHEVHWYTGAAYRRQVQASGAVHHPIRSAEDFGGQTIDQAFPELSGLTGVTMVRRAFKRVFIDNAPGMLNDCRAILAEHPADVMLSEPLFVAVRWLYEQGGPAWATLGETMLGLYSRDTAPVGLGAPPLGGPLGALRNRVMNAVHRKVIFAEVTDHYERARQQVGLPAFGRSFIDAFASPLLYLQATVPSFEYPRRDLPEQLHFIGPLLPTADPESPDEPLPWRRDDRPVVLVTQGTVATDPRHLLIPAVRALSGREWRVLVTTGGPPEALLDGLGAPPGDDVHVARFIPYAGVLERVDVLVTNGGYGTIQQALAHGVPIVVAGATEDKPEVAARVAWSGTGIRIRAQSPAPEQILAAVSEVWHERRYRDRAGAVAAEMAGYDAPRTAAALLEQLAVTKAPVRRTTDPAAGRILEVK